MHGCRRRTTCDSVARRLRRTAAHVSGSSSTRMHASSTTTMGHMGLHAAGAWAGKRHACNVRPHRAAPRSACTVQDDARLIGGRGGGEAAARHAPPSPPPPCTWSLEGGLRGGGGRAQLHTHVSAAKHRAAQGWLHALPPLPPQAPAHPLGQRGQFSAWRRQAARARYQIKESAGGQARGRQGHRTACRRTGGNRKGWGRGKSNVCLVCGLCACARAREEGAGGGGRRGRCVCVCVSRLESAGRCKRGVRTTWPC